MIDNNIEKKINYDSFAIPVIVHTKNASVFNIESSVR